MSLNGKSKELPTIEVYVYTVSKNTEEPFIEKMVEHEEYLVPVVDFTQSMMDFDPELCGSLIFSTVTDVLLIRGW